MVDSAIRKQIELSGREAVRQGRVGRSKPLVLVVTDAIVRRLSFLSALSRPLPPLYSTRMPSRSSFLLPPLNPFI